MADTKKSILDYETVSPDAESTVLGTKNGAVKRFKVSDLGGSSGGGGGIIDVDTLPTENINANAIYRQMQVSVVMYARYTGAVDAIVKPEIVIEPVATLPETGNPCMPFTSNAEYWYYLMSDGKLYGYVDEDLASAAGLPIGWYPIEQGYTLYGRDYKMVYSEKEILDDPTDDCWFALVTETVNLYHYYDGEFSKIITSKNFEFDETTGTLVLNL